MYEQSVMLLVKFAITKLTMHMGHDVDSLPLIT